MSIQARTNQPGVHTFYIQRSNSRFDEEFDPSDGYKSSTTVDTEGVITDLAVKHEVTRSNRVNPTDWRREVGTVTSDSPARYSYTEYGHGGRWSRTSRTTWISRMTGQFAFLPFFKEAEDAQRSAETQALLSLKANRASMGADIATIGQTVDMMAKRVIQGARFLKSLRHGDWGGAASALGLRRPSRIPRSRQAADLWLEYSYGWKPYAQSLYDLHKITSNLLGKDILVHGKGSDKRSGMSSAGTALRRDYRYDTSVRVDLVGRVKSAPWANLESLGLLNPLSVVWEVVPWSFAVDWFIPVGNTLDSLTATVGLEFVRGYTTWRSTASMDASYNASDRTGWDSTSSGSYREELFGVRRYTYDGFPRPGFYVDATPFSTPRVLNALALVRQLLK